MNMNATTTEATEAKTTGFAAHKRPSALRKPSQRREGTYARRARLAKIGR